MEYRNYYRLLFKESPYPGLTENAILNKIKKLGAHNLKKTKNKELDNLIQRLLEKNPKKRIDWDEYLNHSFFKQSKEEDNKSLNFSNNYSIEINQESEDPDVLKVVFLGEPGANKTQLIRQIYNDKLDNPEMNISAQFISKTVKYPEFNKLIKFDLFDTCGQEKYMPLKIFIKDAKVIIFVYDITSKNSFEEIKNYWYKEVKNIYGEKMPILAVVGNNYENYHYMQVSNNEGLQFADEIGAIFQTTSKLSDSGINTLFDNIGKKYIKAKTLMESNKPKSDKPLKKDCIII